MDLLDEMFASISRLLFQAQGGRMIRNGRVPREVERNLLISPRSTRSRIVAIVLSSLVLLSWGGCVGAGSDKDGSYCIPGPQITGTPSPSATVGVQYVYKFTASYACGLFLCYDADGIQLPPGATIDHYYDMVTWTPTASDVNKDFQFVIATPPDNCLGFGGNSASQSWTVHVEPAPPEQIAPYVISTSPANGISGVPVNASITVTFSEAVDPNTVNASSFFVSGPSGTVAGTVTVSDATATFTPSGNLAYLSSYRATVTSAVKDLIGNAMQSDRTWNFVTGTFIASVSPANATTNVPVNANVTALFSDPVDPITVDATSFLVTGPSGTVAGSLAVNGNSVTFTPGGYLSFMSTYSITIRNAVKNNTGIGSSSDYSWSFTTGWTPDSLPPSAPIGLNTGTVTFERLDLSWNASSDNAMVSGYYVYRDGVRNTSTSATTYTDVNFLVLDTPYCYTVSAYDISGNESGLSNSVCATPPNIATGSLAAWGSNSSGQLGDGTTIDKSVAVRTMNMAGVTAIAAGRSHSSLAAGRDHHSLALKPDGTVWAWGNNQSGQLGDGTTTSSTIPVQVMSLSSVIAVSAGRSHSLALRSNGTVWAWGNNQWAQLGDNTLVSRATPSQVLTLNNIIAISAGGEYSLALRSDGTVWAWGGNGSCQLGDGSCTDRYTPVQVPNLSNIIAISAGGLHSLALNSDGTVWGWGSRIYGQLGDNGTLANQFSPYQNENINQVIALAAGDDHSVFLKADGTVWDCGAQRSQYVRQVPNIGSITAIAAGGSHSLALKSDGTVWGWGYNYSGQLGDGYYGFYERVYKPVQTLKMTGISAIAAGGAHSMALR